MRTLFPALVASLLLVGCGKPETAAPALPAAAPAAAKGAPAEGTPRIVVSPDGTHVQYRVYGSGEPALVLIHGWSCDSNYWRGQIPQFKQKKTPLAGDPARHGGTDGQRPEGSMGRLRQDGATGLAGVPHPKVIPLR